MDLPNQRAPSVSSCVAAKGDDPVTAASLPTCSEPSLSALWRVEKYSKIVSHSSPLTLKMSFSLTFMEDWPSGKLAVNMY